MVITSAFGTIRTLFVLARQAGHVLCADDYVAAEAWRNLEVKAPDAVPELEKLLTAAFVRPSCPRPW